ncbi:MAG: hypothetical protein JXA67_22225 [Micromonosporaceae bacterium]|nr:hypothetical protein [Micromonosporaceae bacterium]
MVVRRTSTVRVEARQRARQRTAERREERRRREQRIEELVEQHADALARADEVRQRADREMAEHRSRADGMVVELLTLGETVSAVAELLDVSASEVRAARKRARAGSGESAPGAAGVEEVPEQVAPDRSAPVDAAGEDDVAGSPTSVPAGAGLTPG